jgi:hypothetical protein
MRFFGQSNSNRLEFVDASTLARMEFSDVPRTSRWMHIMPPDDDPFWRTNMEPKRDAAETYGSLTALERDLRKMKGL